MNYRETLDFLFSQLPMFQRIGQAAFKKDLTNTIALLDFLGNPHHQFPTIHIGGTNGKGSVSHALAAILQAAGFKTGLYISPHYKDFRERIKINGTYISPKKVVQFVERCQPALASIQPSFFEMTVGMAFDHFAREQVDIAVVEVGLGGRLDSTNVLQPLLSVITNISYDHQNMLGDTLPQIAFEKAGIIKQNTPVVIGEYHPESYPVFEEKAASCNAPIFCADGHFIAKETSANSGMSTFYNVYKNKKIHLKDCEVAWAGPYQEKNLATVFQIFEVLQTLPFFQQKKRLLNSHRADGLRRLSTSTRFMGRWQTIGQNPTVLCDSAHNEAGLRAVFEQINSLFFNKLHVVTGFVNDKDLALALQIFPTNAKYYFAKANIPRGMEAPLLKEKAATFGLKGRAYRSVKNALRAARRAAATDDLVVVLGSIFVVAEVI